MSERIDRRDFLGAAGATLLAGCGSSSVVTGIATSPRRRSPTRVPRRLEQAMRGHVFERGSPGFSSAAHVFNERFDYVVPRAVARPLNTADVQGAVRWAVFWNVPFRARSGGHSYAGYSTISGGVVLDLRKMNWINVDRRAGTATIGAGAQLIDVYAGLARQGATIPAGSCPSVGIAGVTLGGGMGLAARAFGMTLDNLIAATIVTADGKIRQVNNRTDPGLLWALRGGGGGNFGVVTQFQFRLHRLPSSAAWFTVNWPWSSAAEALAAWQAWAPHTRDQITSIFHLDAGPSVRVAGQYLGASRDLGGLLAALAAVPGARVRSGDQSYLGLQLMWAGCSGMSLAACHTVGTAPGGTLQRMSFRAKSDYVNRPLSSQAIRTLVNAAASPGAGAILFDSYGGAINRVAPGATAFVHRNALYAIQYYNGNPNWLARTYASMRPYVSGFAYQNYIDPGLSTWRQAYYGPNYRRLLAVRRRVDPEHRFNFPQAIGR